MPTIEQRYEGALAVLTEIAHLAVRLATALAAHDAEARRTLNRVCHDHISAAFRLGGDDASVKAIIEELERLLSAVARMDKTQLPAFEAYIRGLRNLGQGQGRYQGKPQNSARRPMPKR